jgi:hypothetical protein
LAQARKVDVILVTELTRWGRSARFAARSLTCFKFRFVSSPLLGKLDGREFAHAVGAPRDQTSRFLHLAPPFRSYRPRGGPVRERLAEHLRGHLSRE